MMQSWPFSEFRFAIDALATYILLSVFLPSFLSAFFPSYPSKTCKNEKKNLGTFSKQVYKVCVVCMCVFFALGPRSIIYFALCVQEHVRRHDLLPRCCCCRPWCVAWWGCDTWGCGLSYLRNLSMFKKLSLKLLKWEQMQLTHTHTAIKLPHFHTNAKFVFGKNSANSYLKVKKRFLVSFYFKINSYF